jgi:hypothetical protein
MAKRLAPKDTAEPPVPVAITITLEPETMALVDIICARRRLSREVVLAALVERSPHLRDPLSPVFRPKRSALVLVRELLRNYLRVWSLDELEAHLHLKRVNVIQAANALIKRRQAVAVRPGHYIAAAGAEAALRAEAERKAAELAGRRPRHIHPLETRAAAMAAWQRGEGWDAVSEKYGISTATLRRWLIAAGLHRVGPSRTRRPPGKG